MAEQARNPKTQGARPGTGVFRDIFVAEEAWSAGFFTRLREYLTEKPVKLPRTANGGAFSQVSFGAGLAENLKELFRPLPKYARHVGGRMVVDWKPWYQQFWENLRDTIAPPKLPPLKVTSKPVQVRDIWSKNEGFQRAQAVSLLAHSVVVILMVIPLYHQIHIWAMRKGLTHVPRIDEYTYLHEVRSAR